mmetsp:Transcript_3460/g.4593  ORF Transcript_3460/g.4593 Transcript_3460/m.4593 type:complete len:377 (-) Transcript_3460:278-1408(-)|eukprot:CAMPEP_0198148932 /NCGR_PEP_ID=MMETSP1443-20131203/44233_1 /TAXON_ID=186043 /ORGANISM="Entomoneis sp., Strain CCMP2396" /LENGTH=376 /DNA_ID=CAMNT_0043813799 /DNA_START=89 /DNA_END=1219 /DNA_ORIENTATION=-
MKANRSQLFSCLLLLKSVLAFTLQNVPVKKESRTTSLFMAVWSDMKAVQDYQDFLSSGRQELDLAKDGPAVIIRPVDDTTPLANCLVEMGMGDDMVLTPGHDLPATVGGSSEYPIYITLPPYQLRYFLMNLPDSYKDHVDDFVFFSGGPVYGNIEDVLKERGYCRDKMTQVVIGGLRIAPNSRPQDLSVNLGLDSNGEPKMANECAACGKWSGGVAERLQRSTIPCATDFYREWRRKMWERNVMDACFHLVGAVRDQPTTLKDVSLYYSAEASDMVWEMSQLLRGWRALTLLFGFEERMFGTAEMQGGETPCKLDDTMYPYIWGNQVFLQSKMFCEYLAYAKLEKGLLPNSAVKERIDADFQSHMRKGNLRADGVV